MARRPAAMPLGIWVTREGRQTILLNTRWIELAFPEASRLEKGNAIFPILFATCTLRSESNPPSCGTLLLIHNSPGAANRGMGSASGRIMKTSVIYSLVVGG